MGPSALPPLRVQAEPLASTSARATRARLSSLSSKKWQILEKAKKNGLAEASSFAPIGQDT